jgi:hypothetical protein
MEKRLQKRIIVKARGSFALEDFELRSPNQKTPLDRSDADREGDRADRRRRRRKKLGPPAEVEAMLEEEERGSAASREAIPEHRTPESGSDGRRGERPDGEVEAARGDTVPDSADTGRHPGTTEVPAGVESPQVAAPVPTRTIGSSETQQRASETTADPAATDAPKPQG